MRVVVAVPGVSLPSSFFSVRRTSVDNTALSNAATRPSVRPSFCQSHASSPQRCISVLRPLTVEVWNTNRKHHAESQHGRTAAGSGGNGRKHDVSLPSGGLLFDRSDGLTLRRIILTVVGKCCRFHCAIIKIGHNSVTDR